MRRLKYIRSIIFPAMLAACNPSQFASASPWDTYVPPSQPAEASAAPGNDCPSGECLPVGDLPGWRQVFIDDFAEPVAPGQWSDCSADTLLCLNLPESYRQRWWAFLGGWTDNANGLYSPSRVLSVTDGVLDFYIHTEGGIHLVAAPVPLIHGRAGPLGQLYGRYAVRFRSDPLRGYKMAWLLWPDSEVWPRDGEIDFPEGNLDGIVEAYLHHQDGTAGNDQAGFSSGVPVSGQWHTAVIEWTAETVIFILDGKVIGAPKERIPSTRMHWVFEVTTALDGTVPDDETAGHVRIDWVAVWEREKAVE